MKKSEADSLPIDGEYNPNHPMTRFSRDQWHKIVAIMMVSFGITEFEITEERIAKCFPTDSKAVVMDGRNNRLIVRLVSMEEAKKLAREEGGLPA